ncbi:unnamed protein product, partial [Anisakis simplex]|uniref:Uncharacterized protein n=1 Tax=Anisakis simplex TaxID=6269 RepID=A0A0M3JNR7_ANISI
MKLTDLIENIENEPQPESPVPKNRREKSPLFGTEVAGRLLRNTRARENRELNGTVLRPPPTTTRG